METEGNTKPAGEHARSGPANPVDNIPSLDDDFQDIDELLNLDPALRPVRSQSMHDVHRAPSPAHPTRSTHQRKRALSPSETPTPDTRNKRSKPSTAGGLEMIGENIGRAVDVMEKMEDNGAKLLAKKTPCQQAQKLMRKETCLTLEGKAIMVEVVSVESKANTYLMFYEEDDDEDEASRSGARMFWIKHRLQEQLKNGTLLEELFSSN